MGCARKPFKPGDFVTRYGGAIVHRKNVHRLPSLSHVRTLNSTHVLDGRTHYKSVGLGSMANRAPKCTQRNCVITKVIASRKNPVEVLGLKIPVQSQGGHPISPGTELLTTYGKSYPRLTFWRKLLCQIVAALAKNFSPLNSIQDLSES